MLLSDNRKRVAIWAAVSSLPQAKKISLQDQLRVGREHAAMHDAEVVAELVVPGESRDIVLFEDACRRIEAYNSLRTLIDAKAIDVLIYLDRSRLGRTAALSMAIAELCNRANILLYETTSPPSSMEFRPATHSDLLIGAVKSVDAQQEISRIHDRHRKGMADRVNGGRMPGKINWGYVPVYDAGKLSGYAVDEEAATTIRLIVSLYLDNGLGALSIADHLNRQGRPAPAGGQWGHSQVTFLLRRLWRYAGFAELNVNSKTGRKYLRSKGNWDAIITEEQVRAVIEERNIRNKTRRSVHTAYRFTRMVYCGVCGSRFHAQRKTNAKRRKDGTLYTWIVYRCPADHTSIGERKIVKAITELIAKLNSFPEFRTQWLSQPAPNHSATIIDSITRLNDHIARLNAGLTKADLDYYGRGALDEESERHSAIVATLKRQIVSAQAEITALQDKLHDEERNAQREQRIDDIATNGLNYLAMDDVRTANAWLRQRFRVVVEQRNVQRIDILF